MAGRKSRQARPASYDTVLRAAIEEYAERGRDGVRLEGVAKRAGVNKALVYRHFKDRDTLFDAALKEVFERRLRLLDNLPNDPARLLSIWTRRFSEDPLFIRMLLREAIESDGAPAHGKARAAYYGRQIDGVAHMQRGGRLPPGDDPPMLFLLLTACVVFPFVLPQIAKLVTGKVPGSAVFQRRWKKQILAILRASPG